MNRLDFMNCPCCSGHEAIGVETAAELSRAINAHLNWDLPEHVSAELKNIRNVIENLKELGRPRPATVEESWLDA